MHDQVPKDSQSGWRLARPKNLIIRTASALVMAPLILAAAWQGGWWFGVPAALIGIYGSYEWNRMAGLLQIDLPVANALVIGTGLTFLLIGSGLLAIAVLAFGAAAVGILAMWHKRTATWPAGGLAYVGLAVLCLVWIRETQGAMFTFWLLFLVWASDIGAYITGSLFGGPKLAPRLSPGKTWAGLVGGSITAGIVSGAFGDFAGIGDPFELGLVGVLLACWSQLGDIVESTIKRRFNVKDSGHLIPGHGGVLDRIDSLVFTVPVVAGVLYGVALNG